METEQTKTIYNLNLHESLQIRSELIVERVPGGWNYIYYHQKRISESDYGYEWYVLQIVFVEYHNEFQIKTGSDF